MTTQSSTPLLNTGKGTFGTHIRLNPAGTYSFTGTVPCDLAGIRGTYEECYESFISWFTSLDNDAKAKHGPNLRNDVFMDCWQS